MQICYTITQKDVFHHRKEEDKDMELIYASTRNKEERVTASQAILKGLAKGGGLYVPTEIPALDIDMEKLSGMTYQETASLICSCSFSTVIFFNNSAVSA